MSSLNKSQVDSDMSSSNTTGARIWRPIAAVAAAVVIAFCGWSAWQYAQGGDPLAFLSGGAFQTVAETSGDAGEAGSAASDPQVTFASKTVTADDVKAAVAGLTFDGSDVSVPSDEVLVVIREGGIWVEQATASEASELVASTARRASALAAWAEQQGVGFSQVTWISEDAKGAVRMAVTVSCGKGAISGEVATLLSETEGYRISGNVYSALGADAGFAQESGDAPALPDGSAITVLQGKTADGEVLTGTKVTNRTLADDDGSTSGSSGSSSGADGSGSGVSSSGGSGSSAPDAARGDEGASSQAGVVTVSITVDGSAAGAGGSSATLQLSQGATVYDALASAGVDYNAKATGYGMYVSSIGGLAEKDHGSMSGWMYSVNGVTAGVACSSYVLSDGDSVYWWYANVEY